MARVSEKSTFLLPLSAKSPSALVDLAGDYQMLLSGEPYQVSISGLKDICYTAGAGRAHHDYRLALVGNTAKELANRLANYLSGQSNLTGVFSGQYRPNRRPITAPILIEQAGQGAATEQDLLELGSLYCQGQDVDWERVYPSGKAIPGLPLYPWQRERYWFSENGISRTEDREKKSPIDDWLYEIEWEAKSLSDTNCPAMSGAWLIFCDRTGIGETLAKRLESADHSCVQVYAGEKFAQLDSNRFRIRPDRREDVARLFREVMGSGESPLSGIVHLWSVDIDTDRNETSWERIQTPGCVNVLHLVQELARDGIDANPRIWVVTQSALTAGEGSSLNCALQSPVVGLGRSIAAELPKMWGGSLDLDVKDTREVSAEWICKEIRAPNTESQVAFRSGQRHIPRLTRKPTENLITPFTCKPDGKYIITGGLGDLGLLVSKWLAGQGARHLLLVSRTEFPAPSSWDDAPAGGRLESQIKALREIESLGAEVQLASADVGDRNQLEAVLNDLKGSGPIRGVVHAAGVVLPRPLLKIEDEELLTVLKPKVAGGVNLANLLEGENLDFFVFFSSAAALLDSPMLGSYAAANSFLDSLAHLLRTRGVPAVSINWGLWEEVGLAARHQESAGRGIAPRGMSAIKPEQGLDILGRLLGCDSPQVAVLPIDWEEWGRFHADAGRNPLLSYLVGGPSAARQHRRTPSGNGAVVRERMLALPEKERSNYVLSLLQKELAELLGFPDSELDSERPLTDLGIDSLMAMDFKNWIEANLGVTVPAVSFLHGPTLSEVASSVLELVSEDSGDRAPDADSSTPIDVISPEQAEELLDKLDDLSDAEVNSLLGQMAPAKDPGA